MVIITRKYIIHFWQHGYGSSSDSDSFHTRPHKDLKFILYIEVATIKVKKKTYIHKGYIAKARKVVRNSGI